MNNWKEFKNEAPKDGQRIALGARGFPNWVQTAPVTWPSCREMACGYTHWLDCTPPPAPSKMEQAWEALDPPLLDDASKWRRKPSGVLIGKEDFEFGWQQCLKAYGLKEGGEAK